MGMEIKIINYKAVQNDLASVPKALILAASLSMINAHRHISLAANIRL